jgi:ADP-ribosylglycohydrolase
MTGGLLDVPELHERRGPGHTCLTALQSGTLGTVTHPINNSKGCGGIMRVAPVGLAFAEPFTFGCVTAAITHGHPSGYLAAGAFAEIIAHLLRENDLREGIASARELLPGWPGHEECVAALDQAVRLADAGGEPSERQVGQLGEGWVAEEALAISVYCALVARDFVHGIALAANHSGDSDSTAALAGNLLGARWGEEILPRALLADLELREVIEQLARRLWECYGPR